MKAKETRKALRTMIMANDITLPQYAARKVDTELDEIERLSEIGQAFVWILKNKGIAEVEKVDMTNVDAILKVYKLYYGLS